MIRITDAYIGSISIKVLNRLKELMAAAAHIENTNRSSIQQFDPKENILHLVGYNGFSGTFGTHFRRVKPFDGCSCGRAIGLGSQVLVEDVRKDSAYSNHLAVVEGEGFRAVKSIPIISPGGNRLGIISTHYNEPQTSWNHSSFDHIIRELVPIFSVLRLPVTV